MNIAGGNVLRIEDKDFSGVNKYVKEINLNGKRYEKPRIPHAEFVRGGKLTFTMGIE